jgi:hypothetical protein
MMRSAWQRPAGRAALAALVVAAAALVPHAARAQADLLDGKVFVTTEGDAGKPANAESVVTFAAGQAHNKSCDQWGYGKGDVKARREGDVVHFETETRSDRYDTRQVWKGTVRGSTIEGIRTFYPKPGFFNRNPEPKEIWFKGTLRPD